MPHLKIGFPSPPGLAAGANNGTDNRRKQLPVTDPCADHPYVDIEQMTSTKSYCFGPSPGDSQECSVGAFGTVRIVERMKGFCDRATGEPAPATGLLSACSMICGRVSRQFPREKESDGNTFLHV